MKGLVKITAISIGPQSSQWLGKKKKKKKTEAKKVHVGFWDTFRTSFKHMAVIRCEI